MASSTEHIGCLLTLTLIALELICLYKGIGNRRRTITCVLIHVILLAFVLSFPVPVALTLLLEFAHAVAIARAIKHLVE
jgi:hypothetical protein